MSVVQPRLAGDRIENREPFDVDRIRAEFPILAQEIHGKPLVYLDSAASSQKPRAVIETIERYYTENNSNIHRGVHTLSERATKLYEDARSKVAKFINAASTAEIIFVRGTTEAINLVAQTYGRTSLQAGDEIIVSAMEHHSNIVPWQMLCEQTGARLRVIPIDDRGEILLDEFDRLLGDRTRLVSIVHISNALGTVNPIREVIARSHARGVPVMIDGAQAVPHVAIDVRELDCDFYAFSGHKMYGPTGVGVLYGKQALLEKMPPYQGGGDMISFVTFEKTHYNVLPYKFEAGTPHISGGIGLGAAIDWMQRIGLDAIAAHEHQVLAYGTDLLRSIDGLEIVGTARDKAGVLSFTLEGVHPHDIGTILDREGVAIRAGHHCAMPVMQRFGLPATARASLGVYNTREDMDALARAILRVKEVFG